MPIKDNNNLLNTINSHIKLRKLKEKHLKVCKADALKQIGANKLELEAQLRKASEEEELAKTKKEKREKEKRLKALLNAKIRDSLSIRNKRIIKLLARVYILYFKELLSNNSRIFASVIGITRTQVIKNKVVAIDSANSILCDLSNLLVVRFYIFSNSALENIGILTNKKVVEMQTNTATALANKLAAVNKLVKLQTFILKILEHIEIFIIVCSFKKVDKHIFRAYNTISIIAQQIIICKGSSYIEKRGQTIFNKFYNYKLESTIIAKFY
ncbi:hypothetical protein HBI52_244600 [Parastagonospora nodorum]|nr:hypothetical protein HBI52_244600 [Parastagonospora nodorum]